MSGFSFGSARRALCALLVGMMVFGMVLSENAGAAEPSSVAAPGYSSGASGKVSSASQAPQLKAVHTSELLDELAAAHGKVILVNFFAAFCGPCRREIPDLMRMRKEIPEEDLVIIGVAIDEDVREADAFVRKMKISEAYPVYYGGEELARAYRIDAIPFNVIYNREGRIEASEAGYVPSAEMKQFLMSLIRR